MYTTLDEWIQRDAITFPNDSSESFYTSIDKIISSLDPSVELLGFGEALHGGEDILMFRNHLFQRLVEKHGYRSIAIESSFPKGLLVNDYISGKGPSLYDEVKDIGFSHGFGKLEANRELVEWMKQYNADSSHQVKLHFYGFDSPTEMYGTDSPSHVIHFVLDYLDSIDSNSNKERRKRIDAFLGKDADWENPAALMDPTKSIGLSPAASSLRIETEELISELHLRRPELVGKSDVDKYLEALQHASVARQLLNYHASLARQSDKRLVELLGIRDSMMADNLVFTVTRERDRGKVFAFAHNSHLKCGIAEWKLGPNILAWWPAGAHINQILGERYVVIGSSVGTSDTNGIGKPEDGTLESKLTALPGAVVLIPTHKGQGLPASEISSLPMRSGSMKNQSYFPFTPQSFTDFDCLAILDSTTYQRGGPPLK